MPLPVPIPGRFIAYDLSPVAEFCSGNCEPYPSLADARRVSDNAFWSLYGVAPNHEAMRIGDYSHYAAAAEIYYRITGCIAPDNPDGLQHLNLPVSP